MLLLLEYNFSDTRPTSGPESCEHYSCVCVCVFARTKCQETLQEDSSLAWEGTTSGETAKWWNISLGNNSIYSLPWWSCWSWSTSLLWLAILSTHFSLTSMKTSSRSKWFISYTEKAKTFKRPTLSKYLVTVGRENYLLMGKKALPESVSKHCGRVRRARSDKMNDN